MVTAHFNSLQKIASGILWEGADGIAATETDQGVDLKIAPEKDSVSTLYFIINNEVVEKKYTIEINFHHVNAVVNIFGLYQLRDKSAIAISSVMNHFVPHCTSKQLWKGVLHDDAKAVFEGKIIVHPHAQKTQAYLTNKNLLLSTSAHINTKPILEIYADDVTCSHGATVGCLDENALFYLRSRGILETHARDILVNAFTNEINDLLPAGIDHVT